MVRLAAASRGRRLPFIFFFNDTATTEIYTLSLHDALPISSDRSCATTIAAWLTRACVVIREIVGKDRKSTRLNSSHSQISYAVFCLKKKTIRLPLLVPNITYAPGAALWPTCRVHKTLMPHV